MTQKVLDMSANRLHVSNPSLSLQNWLTCSASQTVRRSLKVSARMRKKKTEGVLINGSETRYEAFVVGSII